MNTSTTVLIDSNDNQQMDRDMELYEDVGEH